MILTKNFVMLNFPKTGSIYARKVISELYKSELKRRYTFDQKGFFGQHGSIREIPKRYRDKQIITITRNPFSRYVSLYNFRSWVRYPTVPVEKILREFPEYPELTFEQYLRMEDVFRKKERLIGIRDAEGRSAKVRMGRHSAYFINFFYKNPEEIFEKVSSLGPVDPSFNEGISKIHFLRQENLTQDLVNFLSKQGFSDEDLAFIHEMEWMNVSTKDIKNEGYLKYYSDKSIVEKILKEDAFIFGLFPEYLKTVDLF